MVYSTFSQNRYLRQPSGCSNLLRQNEAAISQGSFGVYLARKVVREDQELYQPLIDIDGAPGLEGKQQIDSAIEFARMTIKILDELGVAEHFKIMATGGTGFRAVSNLL